MPITPEVIPAIPHLEVLDRLGRGGFAWVYRVRDRRDGSIAALKVLGVEAGRHQTVVERFAREARAMQAVDHERVMKILEVGEHAGRAYYVMPYYASGTLRRHIRPNHAPRAALKIAILCCEALVAIHKKKIIHRDIKPENILIDGAGWPILSDFGVAAIPREEGETSLTGTTDGLGTRGYASLDRVTHGDEDARADVYSLALVTVELLTALLIPDPTDPWLVDRTPAPVQAPLRRALALDRKQRTRSARAFLKDLQRAREQIPRT